MNHIYRTLWNTALGACVAVAETAKGAGKGASSGSRAAVVDVTGPDGFTLKPACRAALMLLAALSLCTPQAQAANAADATVSLGNGSVATTGNTTTINQASQRLAIDWTNLSTRANEALVFAQPNAQAIALNRITGSNPSEFLGSLTANGQVFILNPNGVLFGAGSQVNVGGLVASTLSMSNADFQAGRNVFTHSGGAGSVVNQGNMTAAPGGYLALLAPEVRNEGVMTASLGTALLAAGNKVTLNLDNGSLLGYSIDQGAINALAENKQLIKANGGQVLLSAKAMDALTTATVNNTGVIEARTIQNKAGRIMLMGDMETGTTNVAGTLDVSAPNGGDGGFIETSAATVKIAAGTHVTALAANGKTGKWLIDPHDFTIAATGGDMTGAQVGAALLSADLEIQSSQGANAAGNGDINVNDNVSWSANTLTLTAARDVNINAVMTASGTSQLAMNPGTANGADAAVADGAVKVGIHYLGFDGRVDFGGRSGAGFLSINGQPYTVINALGAEGSVTGLDLQGMNGSYTTNYALGADIDASPTALWASGDGFLPISPVDSVNPALHYRGNFNGLGHTISNLTVRRPSGSVAGLFGVASSATFSNVGIVGGSFSGAYVGPLVGGVRSGSATTVVRNAFASAAVSALATAGGLVGSAGDTSIYDSHAAGPVDGVNYAGGLAGIVFGAVERSYATGNVSTSIALNGLSAGGLLGEFRGSVVRDSYASGNVSGEMANAGGLIGSVQSRSGVPSVVENSYATGSVTPSRVDAAAGGLVGNLGGSNITRSYATGSVQNDAGFNPGSFGGTGGLVGINSLGSISLSYATGTVRGYHTVGGLVGSNEQGSISLSYAIGTVGGYETVGGLVGRNTGGTITDSYATGSVTGHNYVGGLAGQNFGTIRRAYATGNVTGDIGVGGFVGLVSNATSYAATIEDAYATGNVTGDQGVGGFAGLNGVDEANTWQPPSIGANLSGSQAGFSPGFIQRAFATGNVTGNTSFVFDQGVILYDLSKTAVGGFLGANAGPRYAGIGVDGWYTGTVSGPDRTGLQAFSEAFPVGTYEFIGVDYGFLVTPAQLRQVFLSVNTGGTALQGNWRMYDASPAPLLRGLLTPLTVTADNTSRVYDGGTATSLANASYSVAGAATSGLLLGQATPYGTAKQNVGTYAPSGLYSTQQGYDITYAGGNATVTPKPITASGITAASRDYDGTTDAVINTAAASVAAGLVGTDVVVLDSASAAGAFADKNAGTGKTVNVTGLAISGADAANYSIAGAAVTADITRKALTAATTTASDKAYDGNTTAVAGVSGLAGFVGAETVGVASVSASFNSKDVATANLVTVSGVTLADGNNGGLASNYSIAAGGTAAANITAKALTYSTAAANKTYDGDTTASASLSLIGLVNTETLGSTAGATFNTKDVATANLVTVNSATLANGSNGGLASNYSIAAGGTAASNIMAKALTYGTAAVNKTYDGDTTAAATLSGLAGLVGTETVAVTSTAATFNTKDVATANLVTVNSATLADGSNGGLGSNYRIAAGGTAAANITAKALTVTVAGVNKVYDGTTVAALAYTDNRVAGDSLGFSSSASFSDKNVGTAKTVTYSSVAQTGADAGNYSLVSATSGVTAADITPNALTVTANTDSRLAGSTPYAGGNGVNYSGFVAGETTAVLNGALAYGGNSQGASAAGNYAITPGGYSATNYTLTYVDGVLNIRQPGAGAAAVGGTALVPAYESTLQGVAGIGGSQGGPQNQNVFSGPDSLSEPDNGSDGAGGNGNGNGNGNSNGGDGGNARLSNSLVSIVNCGLLMPKGVNSAICE